MKNWTSTALQALEEYLDNNRSRFEALGADAEEVMADVRRHVEAEIEELRLPVVTEADIARIVNRMGVLPPEETAPLSSLPPTLSEPTPSNGFGPFKSGTLLFFGVIVPIASLVFELGTHMCAGAFFDPLPTWFHVLLVAGAIFANAAAWLELRKPSPSVPPWLWLANGAATGISLFYAGLYLPMAPFAFLGIIVFGFGLLPLAPLFSFGAALYLRKHLRLTSVQIVSLRHWWWAALLPLVFLGLFEVRGMLTRHWMAQATQGFGPVTTAIQRLRIWGSQDVMLQECYGTGNRMWVEFYGSPRPDTEAARHVFYRVTGKPFSAFPAPLSKYQRGGRALFDEFDWDAGLGGNQVAAPVKGLSLLGSRFDGLCEPDEGWGYVEWTMEFRNSHSRSQREARAQIELPPGAVVSRLTLWVNGEEREAAFAGRAQVREAYQQVAVRQRRDPVLVTTSGPDRILVQCFPIAPEGGTMKIRLGITAPLILESETQAALKLPCLVERNFAIASDFQHSYWLQTPRHSEADPTPVKQQGQLADPELVQSKAVLRFTRSAAMRTVRASDERTGTTVEQVIEPAGANMPRRLALVLDGSAEMNAYLPQIATALDGLPARPALAVWLAQDGSRQILNRPPNTGPAAGVSLPEQLRHLRGVGGQDALPALLQAWEWAAAEPEGVVLWIHGSQPVLLSSVESLKQRLEWQADGKGPVILDMEVAAGPNRIGEQLASLAAFTTVPRLGTFREDLDHVFAVWSGRREQWKYTRTPLPQQAGLALPQGRGSTHVVRLWAAEQARNFVRHRKIAEAVKLAALHQLVTPVTGAVVLETQAQYQAAGLTPVDASTVPSVPEPATWCLLFLALGFFIARAWIAKMRSPRIPVN